MYLFFPGEYEVNIKFNDQHIPDSPIKLFISPAIEDAHKLEVKEYPTSERLYPYTPLEIVVCKNGAKGELYGKVGLSKYNKT